MTKTWLVCLLGETPAVVYEIARWSKQNQPENPKVPEGALHELWIVGTSANQEKSLENEIKYCTNEFENNLQIPWRRFIIEGTGDVHNTAENERIGEGILRVLLVANQEAKKQNGQVWLGIAGGRKTMSSYGHLGQLLMPINQILHIVAGKDLEKKSLQTIAKDWDKYKDSLYPILLPDFGEWHSLFYEFFLGLGNQKKLEYDCYPLYPKAIPKISACERYSIPEKGPWLLQNVQLVSQKLGKFLSLSGGISFSALKHDLETIFQVLAREEDKKNRKQWSNLLKEYLDALRDLGNALKQKENQMGSPFSENSNPEQYLWDTVYDVVAIVNKRFAENKPQVGQPFWSCSINDKTFSFGLECKNISSIPERKCLLPLLRNLLSNMARHGKSDFNLQIQVSHDCFKIISKNKVTPEQAKYLAEKIGQDELGLPGTTNYGEEGEGLGLYAIRIACEIMLHGELKFNLSEDTFIIEANIRR